MKFVGGTVYTYVEIEMFPFHRMTSSKPRTKYIRNEFSPVFNDEVCIKILKEEVDDQNMYLHVCDYNQISTRDLIGSYKLNLDDVSFKSKGKETVYEGDLRWIDSVSHALFFVVWSSRDTYKYRCETIQMMAVKKLPGNHRESACLRCLDLRVCTARHPCHSLSPSQCPVVSRHT